MLCVLSGFSTVPKFICTHSVWRVREDKVERAVWTLLHPLQAVGVDGFVEGVGEGLSDNSSGFLISCRDFLPLENLESFIGSLGCSNFWDVKVIGEEEFLAGSFVVRTSARASNFFC